VIKEFVEFLKQYGVVGLAIAVIIGGKANAMVTAFVDGILMPIVGAVIPGGAWRTATLDVGPVKFLLGPLVGAVIDFVIVAALVFVIAKTVLKQEKVAKI
jgi:large conductance mechanosensitive channel